MNPLIEKTVERIAERISLNDGERLFISIEIGYAITEALRSLKSNPNSNMKGGNHIDYNTIGNEILLSAQVNKQGD